MNSTVKEILEWMDEILDFGASRLEKRNKDNKNCYYIRAGGQLKTYKISKTLYENATVYLDRKFEKYTLLSKSRS